MITDDPWVFCYVCVCQDNGPHYFWLYTYIHTQYPGKKSSQIQHGYLVRAREFFLAVEIMTMSNYRFLTVLSGAGGRDMVKGQAVPPDIHVDSTWTPPPPHNFPVKSTCSLLCIIPLSCATENRDKRRQLRWQQQQRWSIASLKTGTTDVKWCRLLPPASPLPVSISQCHTSVHKALFWVLLVSRNYWLH